MISTGNVWEEMAVESARMARSVVRKFIEEHQNALIETKGSVDLVTKADMMAQSAILRKIKSFNRSCVIYSEELPKPQKIGNDPHAKIVIDPIDGSYRLYKNNLTNVSTGVLILDMEDRPIAAAVSDFDNEDVYYAGATGAFLNGREIQSSNRKDLDRALIAVYAEGGEYFEILPKFSTLVKKGARIDNYAGHVTKCRVASGIYDAAIEFLPAPLWEFSSVYIAQMSGAFVSNLEGKPISYGKIKGKQSVIVSSTEELGRKILKEFGREK